MSFNSYFNKAQNKPKINKTRCWESHPPYKIGEYVVIGGSCTSEYPDVDVFVGLDWSVKKGKRGMPWNSGFDIYFPIPDMGTPPSIVEFKKLLKYLKDSLVSGKSVYIGCIGGHGRTGLVLAALTTYMIGDKDSITTVRRDYCHKAVESTKQVKWLTKNFGIKSAEASKTATIYGLNNNFTKSQTNVVEGTLKLDSLSNGKVTNSDNRMYRCVKGGSIFE